MNAFELELTLSRMENLEACARWSDAALMFLLDGHDACFRRAAELSAHFGLEIQGRL